MWPTIFWLTTGDNVLSIRAEFGDMGSVDHMLLANSCLKLVIQVIGEPPSKRLECNVWLGGLADEVKRLTYVKSYRYSSLIRLKLVQAIFNVVVNGVKGRGGAASFAEAMLVTWWFTL